MTLFTLGKIISQYARAVCLLSLVSVNAGPTPMHGQPPVHAGALAPSVSNMAVLLKKEKC